MVFFNEVEETFFGLTTKYITKSILAPVENRFIRKTAADGSFDFGSFLGNRLISITFQDVTSTTKTELYNNMLQIAAWLYPLDKLSKKLQIVGEECGEDGKYYIAKVDGESVLEEVLEYGVFTITFVCVDPYKKSNDQNFLAGVVFDRNSTAWQDVTELAVDQPRFYPIGSVSGLMIEEGVTNQVWKSDFATSFGGIPDDYSESAANATGSHDTTAGVYTATMANSTANGAYFGMAATDGLRFSIPNTTDRIAASAYVQVTLGLLLAQISLYFLDTAYNPLPTLSIQIGSSSRIRFVFENQNQATQQVVGIGLEAYATISGNTGAVEFSKPMIEVNNINGSAHTYQEAITLGDTPRLDENVLLNIGPITPNNPFYLAITIFPNWGKTDLQGDVTRRSALILHKDVYNRAGIFWNANLEQWEAFMLTEGLITYVIAPVVSFNAGDQIKLYMLRESTQYKLLIKVNSDPTLDSGYTTDTRGNPIYNTLFIGSQNYTEYINAIVKDVIYNDTDPSPDPTDYI